MIIINKAKAKKDKQGIGSDTLMKINLIVPLLVFQGQEESKGSQRQC